MRLSTGSFVMLIAAHAASPAAAAPASDGTEHVAAATLDTYVAKTKSGLAFRPIFADAAAGALVVRRDGPGEVERHALLSDIMVAREGAATILLGGRIEGGREVTAGEWRGGRIVGGRVQSLRKGDLLWIPAGVPHQMLIKPRTSFTYLAVKVAKH